MAKTGGCHIDVIAGGRGGEPDPAAIADIACWPRVRAAGLIGVQVAQLKNLARWFDAIAERPRCSAARPPGSMQTGPAPQKVRLTRERWSHMFGDRILEAAHR